MRNLFGFTIGMDHEIYVSNNDLWIEINRYLFCPEKSNQAILPNFNSMVLALESEKVSLANHEG